jgi:hypothetical protein
MEANTVKDFRIGGKTLQTVVGGGLIVVVFASHCEQRSSAGVQGTIPPPAQQPNLIPKPYAVNL